MLVTVLCYKFGFNLSYVTNLTIPQIKILEKNLSKILRAEAGEKDVDGGLDRADTEKYLANRIAFGETLKMLKEKTGKDKFTMAELTNPAETIKKYGVKNG